MKTRIIIISAVIALMIYVTVTPIVIYKSLHKQQVKEITIELLNKNK